MPMMNLCHFDVTSQDLDAALEECDTHLAEFDVPEAHVVSVNVLAAMERRARVVMVYWRQLPIG